MLKVPTVRLLAPRSMTNISILKRHFKFPAPRSALTAAVIAIAAAGLMMAQVVAWAKTAAGDAGGAASGHDAAVLDHIQNHYQASGSFNAKFTEELTGIGGTKRTRTGRVFYKRPGKMRWEFDAPQTETVVSDGRMLYDYQPDLNQVLEVPIKRAFKSATPLAFLLGMGDIRRDFNATVEASTPSDSLLRVMLVPKSGGDRVEIGVDPSTYALMAVKVTDAVGNTTSIRFKEVHTNLILADSLFNFKIPPGADVVLAPAPPPQSQQL
jgi:outer membrane lipoprotein carrier protein